MAKSYHQILLPEKIELAGPLAEAYYNLLHGPTISYQNSPHAIGLIDLENELFGTGGWAEGHSYSGIKNIVGTKYDDVIKGNSQNNYLFGGAGADIFVLDSPKKIFAQADKILDFTRGEDKIDVRTSLNDAAEVWVSREHKDNQTNMVIYENASKSVILGVLDNYSGDLGAQDFQDDVTVNEIL